MLRAPVAACALFSVRFVSLFISQNYSSTLDDRRSGFRPSNERTWDGVVKLERRVVGSALGNVCQGVERLLDRHEHLVRHVFTSAT